MGRRRSTALCAIFLFAAVIAAGSMMAGCGREDAARGNMPVEEDRAPDSEDAAGMKKTVIRFAWWGGQERADLTEAALALFMEKNPDIEVETCFYPYESYYENLLISVETGHAPDVFQSFVGAGEPQRLVDEGEVEPLDEYVENGWIDISAVSESLIADARLDGRLYGLPFGINTRVMLTAPDIYQKAGLIIPKAGYPSWEVLEMDMERLKEATGKYAATDILKNEGDVFQYYCRQKGESVFASQGESLIGFSKETYVEFYNRELQWDEKGWIPPIDVSKSENGAGDDFFVKGEAAITLVPVSQYGDYVRGARKRLEIIPLPGAASGKAAMVSASHHLCMSSMSEHKEAAARLMDFLINDVEGNCLMKAERGLPASSIVREKMENVLDYPQRQAAAAIDQAVRYCSPGDTPPMAGSAKIQELLQEYEERIRYRDITPEEAYEELVQAADLKEKKR